MQTSDSLQQALVGEGSGEEKLFSALSAITKDGGVDDLGSYIKKLKDQYGVSCSCPEVGESPMFIDFKCSMPWSIYSVDQMSLQKHCGMVVGFCVNYFLIVRLSLTAIILNYSKVHTGTATVIFLKSQEDRGLIYL